MSQTEALGEMIKAAHVFAGASKRAAETGGDDEAAGSHAAAIVRSIFLELLNEVPAMRAVMEVPRLQR